jgi:hypothetical protein
MSDYYLDIAISTLSFTSVALTLTLVLGFWGRLVLRLTRLRETPRHGELQSVVAGAALAAFLANLALGFAKEYRLFLTIYYYAGLLGFVAELAWRELPGLLRAKDQAAELKKIIANHDHLVALAILSVVLSAFYSAVWPSGELELWLFSNQDCYFWPLLADYWLGLVDPAVIPVTPRFLLLLFENFGTHMLFGLAAVADGQSATHSLPVFLLVLVVWCGLGVRSMARLVFGLRSLAALAVTLGVVGGTFFTYLYFSGTSPQLVAMVAFLAAMEAIFDGALGGGFDRRAWARVLIPVSFILVAYQGGFVCFVAILGLARGFLRIFALDGPGWLGRLWRGILATWAAILGLAASSAVLYPWLGSRMFGHTSSVAQQTSGWNLPFLGGGYLSGLPIFPGGDFRYMEPASAARHLALLAIVTALALLAARALARPSAPEGVPAGGEPSRGAPNRGAPSRGAPILALTATFVVVSLMYVGAYLVKGDFYQLWKFASYVVLPLSFVPTALALALLARLGRGLGRALVAAGALGLLAFWAVSVSPPDEIPEKTFGVQSSRLYFQVLRNIFTNAPPETEFIFYFHEESAKFFVADFLKGQNNIKFNLTNENYIFKGLENYRLNIKNNDNFLLISDIKFDNTFLSKKQPIISGTLYINDPVGINKSGYNKYFGIDIMSKWKITNGWFTVEATLPEVALDQPTRILIRLSQREGDPGTCAPASTFAFHTGGPPVWSPPEASLELEGVIPPELVGQRTIRASVIVGPTGGGSWLDCSYHLESVEFLPAEPASASLVGEAEPGGDGAEPDGDGAEPDGDEVEPSGGAGVTD